MSLANTSLDSDYNAFKNLEISRDELDLPTSVAANTLYTDSITFTIQENAKFIEAYAYLSDYNQYFNRLDSNYFDIWTKLNAQSANSTAYLLLTDASTLEYFDISLRFSGNQITVTLSYNNATGSTITFVHPTFKVPIAFVEYTLAR